jgi:UPF0755 protein
MNSSKYLFFRILLVVVIACAGYYTYSLNQIPSTFKTGSSFVVEEGESLLSISTRLHSEGYIKSPLWFRAGVSMLGRDKHVQLGGYEFTRPLTLYGVIRKLVYGKPDTPLVSITIPEGSTTAEIAEIAKKQLPNFSMDIFGEKVQAVHADGKLFPSTYYLLPSTTEERVVEIMTNEFEKQWGELFTNAEIPRPLTTKDDVINLAALLEGEAKSKEDMQIVAGILLQRLKNNMRLQADAALETYKHAGLPYEPINNPGLNSLYAALHPIQTSYLYYLHANDGTMYFAKTYSEHKNNIKKYLR